MYEKSKTHSLNTSVSNLFDNLDVLVEKDKHKDGEERISFAYINQFEINFLHSSFGNQTSNSKITVERSEEMKSMNNNAKWCKLEKQHVLVVANYEGVLIYDAKGEVMLFWHGIQPNKDSLDFNLFCRGVTCVDGKWICVGGSLGEVLIIAPHRSSFQLVKKHHDHRSAITSLHHNPRNEQVNFASADDSGSIYCYIMTDAKTIVNISQTPSEGVACTCVKLGEGNLLIGGYMTGHIKLFDASSAQTLAIINAHARILTSLDVVCTPRTCYIVSGSEDTFVRVWKVDNHESDGMQIEQAFSESLQLQPCGVRFCDDEARSFAASCYDARHLFQFTKTS